MERVYYIPWIDEIVVWAHECKYHRLVVQIDRDFKKEYEIIYLGDL